VRPAELSLEADFYPGVASAALALLTDPSSRMRRVLREVLVGRVYPDLLLGEWRSSQSPFAARRLTTTECAILHDLQEGSATVTEFRTGSGRGIVLRDPEASLVRLQRLGLVSRDDRGAWRRESDERLDAVRLTAVEAKLTRWQEALAQALNTRLFVHRAFVLLDSRRVEIDDMVISTFRAQGVGLLVRQGRGARVVVQGVHSTPTSHEWIVAVDKLLHTGTRALRAS